MSDLIDRQATIDYLVANVPHDNYGDELDADELREMWTERINKIPSAEPQERKGHWQITDAYPHNVYCSKCHKRFAQTHWAVWEDGSLPRKFCPNCGARMEVTE